MSVVLESLSYRDIHWNIVYRINDMLFGDCYKMICELRE